MDEACFSLSRLRKRPRRPGPRLAAIDAEPKPFAETPDEKWAQIKANKKKVLRETWSNRAAVIDQVNMEVDGEGGDHDPYLPLLQTLQVLQAEMVEHEQFINKQSALYIANKDNWGKSFSAPYGLPLGIKVDARYEYWPACKEKLPLRHYCARMLLAGSKASTCSNERLHSVSGRALLRSCDAVYSPAPWSSSH